jgi:ferredoxin
LSEEERSRLEAWERAWEKAAAGTVAVVDCREEIPCNPCEEACRRGAIVVGEDICAPPRYDPDSCDGCGRCVALCPGMAVFLLDRSGGDGKAHITVAYEMREDMKVGAEAWAMDGEGKPLGRGKIIRATNMGGKGGTALVTLEVPEVWALKVRGVRDRVMSVEEPHEAEGHPGGEDCYLCRCEEIPGSRVRELAESGLEALNALRRMSRAGLGYCQGRFCQSMLAGELSAVTRREREELGTFRVRPPVRPVKLSRLGGEDD